MPTINTDTEEGKAELAKIIEAAVGKATEGLKAKNAELLGNQKELKTKLEEEAAAKAAAEEEAAKKSGDINKITEALEAKFQKELKARDDKLSAKDAALHKLLIDNGLTEALTKAGIAPQYLDATKALIQTQNKAEIVEAGGTTTAQINGKAISEFVSEWSQGDNGKHFVAAQNNSGGSANGANGGGKAAAGKSMSRTDFENLEPAQRMKFSSEGGKLTD